MSRDVRALVDDMRDCCTKILAFTTGMTLEEFLADVRTRDAVERNLFVLGEAAKGMPVEIVRERVPALLLLLGQLAAARP